MRLIPGALCFVLASPALAAPEGLALWYPMEEGHGPVLADRAGGRSAAVTDGEWVRNSLRSALRFNGTATCAALEPGQAPALAGAFSVDLWFSARTAPDPVALVVLPHAFRLLLYPVSRKMLVEVTGDKGRIYADPAAPVRPGQWQHAALVYAPGEGARLYLDGERIFEDRTDAGAPGATAGPLRIGLGVNPQQRRYFRGMMGGIRIWTKALTEKEIAQMVQEEKAALTPRFRGPDDLKPTLPPVAALDVGSRRQLFIDGRFMEAARGVRLRMNPPQKLGVVLKPEKPWEDKSIGFCASVMEHEGVYKLFYESWSTKGTCVCLATSQDGVRWERPSLGVVELDGSRDNNIVYRGTGESVIFLDPHGKAEERFKMVAMQDWPSPQTAGLYVHTSPDGLHWQAGSRVFDLAPDTANQAAWDNQRGKYVAYVRKWDPLRKVGRIEMDDIMQPWPYTRLGEEAYFIWGRENIAVPSREMPTAFGYDERDPVVSDHYNPAVVEYPWAQSAYFAFPSAYMHFPEPPAGKYGNDGLLDIQMAVSRDGVEFHRPERGPYVPLGLAGEPDSLSNYMAVGMLRAGDYLYQYYGAYDVTHGLPESEQKMPIGSFCAVRQRLDGFVSADAEWDGGEVLTPPMVFSGRRLVLNLDTSAMGACRVGVLDESGEPIQGLDEDACDELRGNATAMAVTWGGKGDLSALAGKPVRLHFVMRAAKLYAFEFGAE